ncbi:MAG TPA: NAD(P)/FAD-dependent oxidoreductase [Desulfomonilia bacterium]
MKNKIKIGIVGCGFAGLFTVSGLRKKLKDKVDITIFDRNNYLLYTPMMHEVATGSLNARHIVVPLREILDPRKVNIRCEEVLSVDLKDRSINTATGKQLFDYIVVAPGSVSNFYGIPGVEERCITFKNITDVVRLRNEIITVLEKATLSRNAEEKARLLSISVAGAGCTGCEVVAEIAQFISIILKRGYPEIEPSDVTINLIEASGKVLPSFPEYLSGVALERLRESGIKVRLNSPITGVDDKCIMLKDGTCIPTGILVWAAGIKAPELLMSGNVKKDTSGRIIVDASLQVPGNPGVYSIGDFARTEEGGRPLASTASVAVQQAAYVAGDIKDRIEKRKSKPFKFNYRGDMASLGFMSGVSEVYGIKIKGFPAWMLWKIFKLAMLPRYKNRFQIMADWIITWLFKRDTSRFIEPPCR